MVRERDGWLETGEGWFNMMIFLVKIIGVDQT